MEKRNFKFGLIVLTGISLDQITKFWAIQNNLATFNTGISFQLFSGASPIVYALLSLIFLGIILKICWSKRENRYMQLALSLIVAGTLSNVFDRFIHPGVVDFLPIPLTNIHNNLADWGIGVGVVMIVYTDFLHAVRK